MRTNVIKVDFKKKIREHVELHFLDGTRYSIHRAFRDTEEGSSDQICFAHISDTKYEASECVKRYKEIPCIMEGCKLVEHPPVILKDGTKRSGYWVEGTVTYKDYIEKGLGEFTSLVLRKKVEDDNKKFNNR